MAVLQQQYRNARGEESDMPEKSVRNGDRDRKERNMNSGRNQETGQKSDRQELAVRIFKAVRNRGWDFPQKISVLARVLAENEIDWRKMGYAKVSRLFEDFSDYFTVHELGTRDKLVDYKECLKTAAELDAREARGMDMIAGYFRDGIQDKRIWKKKLTEQIYCFHNWDKTALLLTKMTGVYDLSPEGWLDYLAFSYHLAVNNSQVMENSSGSYLCFDTGLLAAYGDAIYLLAGKNVCETPQWFLLGFATVYSRFMGGILKYEFHLS